MNIQPFVSADPGAVAARMRSEFERQLASAGGDIVLFGAGRLGRIALAGLRKIGIEPAGFADNAPALWTTFVDGLQVFSPEEAVNYFKGRALFVITVYTNAPVRKQLAGLDAPHVPFAYLAFRYPDVLLPHGALDIPRAQDLESAEVVRAATLWADDASRQEYFGQLAWRTTFDPKRLPAHLSPRETYFPSELVSLKPDEFFVDCGAFDGDSVRWFLSRQDSFRGRIVAIEPDPQNFERLLSYIETLPDGIRPSVEARAFAVGETRQRVTFDATGTAGSSAGTGTIEVDCAPLDEILAGEEPSYIKFDIEGAEMEALRGARRILTANSPVLAVCLYHRPEDLWRIPLYLADLNVGYRLFLRRYSDECWEQVCYAIPRDRCISRDSP